MSFNWHNYLVLAKSLECSTNEDNRNEAACRASISRAYYAVYGLSCNYLCYVEKDQHLEWAVKFNNSSIRKMILAEYKSFHSYVIKQFENSDPDLDTEEIKEKKLEIAEELRLLKRRRKKADYDDKVRNIRSETEASIESADEIVKRLKYLKMKKS